MLQGRPENAGKQHPAHLKLINGQKYKKKRRIAQVRVSMVSFIWASRERLLDPPVNGLHLGGMLPKLTQQRACYCQ